MSSPRGLKGKAESSDRDLTEELKIVGEIIESTSNDIAALRNLETALDNETDILSNIDEASIPIGDRLIAQADKINALEKSLNPDDESTPTAQDILREASDKNDEALQVYQVLVDKIDQKKSITDYADETKANAAPVADDYFFAHNEAEYNARKNEIAELDNNFANYHQNIERINLEIKILSSSVITREMRDKLKADIEEQLNLLNKYKGFLADEVCRFSNMHTDRSGVQREDAFKIKPALNAGESENEAVMARMSNIRMIEAHRDALIQANSTLASVPNAAADKSVYYSMLKQSQICPDAKAATDAAYAFLGSQRQLPTDRADVIVGREPEFTTEAKHQFRFIGTEVMVKQGKPAIPVAFVQETGDNQQYCKQTLHIIPGDMKKLDDLPFGTDNKIAKIAEQMRFVAHTIETSLASVSVNGPISIKNWPDNLARAAAVYCYHMGYDFNPKTIRDKISAEQMSTFTGGFKKQLDNEPEFRNQVNEAMARRDLKKSVEAPKLGKS
ncbi:MAG TPA: hypothetical protein VL360_07945 [Gammaproteobacteria bacterium]|nr:hypothetical protein [Gammaproteobacteria bacterium]